MNGFPAKMVATDYSNCFGVSTRRHLGQSNDAGWGKMMRRILLPLALAVLTGTTLAQSTQPGIPTEPGMYLVTAGKVTDIIGQTINFKRSGSLLVSGVTAGIKTRKENVQLLGPHAQTVSDERPVFYFIPAKQEADAGVNAGDILLILLEEKPERRQFEVGAQGLWRASSGISITHQIQLLRSEEKPNVYKIAPANALGKGEYALYLTRGEGLSPYVYDFSVPKVSINMTLTSTPNPSTGNEAVTLTATLVSNETLPNGQVVSFSYKGTTLGAITIAEGKSVFTTVLPRGSDVVTATYSGDVTYGAASASVTQTVR